jgi:UDP-3-O-[3-hydroxymyristoyl] N-acetylglucosamine deacetylase
VSGHNLGQILQKTVKKPITIVGKGLHGGQPATLVIHPASAGQGVWFRRTDVVDRDNLVPARYDFVNDTRLCTCIANQAGTEISTIEHLMAALSGTGVHNALIEIDGPEVPIMDGSAEAFVQAILATGVQALDAPVQAIRVLRKVSLSLGDVEVSLAPSDTLEIDFEIDFEDGAIGEQAKQLTLANGAFVRELSDSRTFCRYRDVAHMKSIGLALGGGLENAIVVEGDAVLNPEGFRHADECVRHKMLDALGDLALAGMPVLARYHGVRAGHRATNLLLRKLFATPDAWEMVVCDADQTRQLPGTSISRDDFHRNL